MLEGIGAIQRGAQQHISSSVRSSDSSFFSGISHGVLFGLGTKPVTTGITDLQRQPRRFYPPFSTEQGKCIFGLTFFCRWISSILYDIPQVSFEYQSKHLHNSQFVHCAIPMSVPLPRPSPLLIKHKEHSPSAPQDSRSYARSADRPDLEFRRNYPTPMPEYSHHSPHTATKTAVNGTENWHVVGRGP
jgi:hypothetical protein